MAASFCLYHTMKWHGYLWVYACMHVCMYTVHVHICLSANNANCLLSLFSWINKPNTHVMYYCMNGERASELRGAKRIRGEKREKNDCTIYGNWAAIATLSWLCSYKECGGLQVPYPMHALCKSTQQKSFLCTQRVWRNEPTKTTNKSWEIQRVKFGKRNFPTCFSLQSPAMLAFLLACLVVLIASLPCLFWFALLFLVVVGNVGVVAIRPLCTFICANTNSWNLYSHKIHSDFMIWFYGRAQPVYAYMHSYILTYTTHHHQWINFIIPICVRGCTFASMMYFSHYICTHYNFWGEKWLLESHSAIIRINGGAHV